jgi:hypothetical protein
MLAMVPRAIPDEQMCEPIPFHILIRPKLTIDDHLDTGGVV